MAKSKQDSLEVYNAKRDFKKTKEPKGASKTKAGQQPIYVVQKHAATRLHWDFRLELNGVLKSWAVTNEPVADPEIKRLAVRTEDHPISYATFAGDIPKGEYGGGHVDIWDNGTWQPHEDPETALNKGKLGFTLRGGRMEGDWALVKLKNDRSSGPKAKQRENWLLIKEKQDFKASDAAPVKPKSSRAWVKAVTAGGPKKMASISFKPELATRVATVPEGDDWLHELKFDGYRALIHINKSKVQVVTRNGLDWTHRFPKLVAAMQKLKVDEASIDGEIVVMDAKGRTDFSALQMTLAGESDADFTFMAFDLLKLDGKDTTKQMLLERKQQLAKLIKPLAKAGIIRFSDHVIGQGDRFFKEAKKLKAEGIISKRIDSKYKGTRSGDWLKIKTGQRQEFVIGGFTRRSDNSKNIGSLLIGVFKGKDFVYAGRVGTGFAGPVSDQIMVQAEKLVVKTSAFTKGAKPDVSGVTWLKPVLVGEVEFAEFTRDGVVRHGAFKGLREDKTAKQVSLEEPVTTKSRVSKKTVELILHGITITHPDRVVYPEDGYTKGDVAQFYAKYADLILKDLAGRPLSVMRCPDGSKACFFQRHIEGRGASVKQLSIKDSKSGDAYFSISTPKDLISLVQLNVLEFHAWNTDKAPFKKPDRLIFDLDPDLKVDWPSVVAAAEVVRDTLHKLGLKSWVKTTGGKGLHVVVPLQRAPDWKATKAFCRAFADMMERDYPKAFTSNPLKVKRKNKIYLDYLRNDDTATAVAAYTLRARPGATISVPVSWAEVKKLKTADFYNIANINKRFGEGFKDPWGDMQKTIQSLTAQMLKDMH